MFCWFWHKWSKWSDPKPGKITASRGGVITREYIADVQFRDCLKCNERDWREV